MAGELIYQGDRFGEDNDRLSFCANTILDYY